jgi:hypothetical protein
MYASVFSFFLMTYEYKLGNGSAAITTAAASVMERDVL